MAAIFETFLKHALRLKLRKMGRCGKSGVNLNLITKAPTLTKQSMLKLGQLYRYIKLHNSLKVTYISK